MEAFAGLIIGGTGGLIIGDCSQSTMFHPIRIMSTILESVLVVGQVGDQHQIIEE